MSAYSHEDTNRREGARFRSLTQALAQALGTPRTGTKRMNTQALVLGLVIGIFGLVLTGALAGPLQAQSRAASHTVTISVQEVTQIELDGDLNLEVEQGKTETATSTYSVLANGTGPLNIQATADTDGDLTGVEMSVDMEAPSDESRSLGEQVILNGGKGKTQVLLENVGGTDASDVPLAYAVTASATAPAGTASVSVTYTISGGSGKQPVADPPSIRFQETPSYAQRQSYAHKLLYARRLPRRDSRGLVGTQGYRFHPRVLSGREASAGQEVGIGKQAGAGRKAREKEIPLSLQVALRQVALEQFVLQ